MSSPPLYQHPNPKLLKNQLRDWQHTFNVIKSAHSFGQIKTWKDYLKSFGMSEGHIEYAFSGEQLNRKITWPELKLSLEAVKWTIEQEGIEYAKKEAVEHTYEGYEYRGESNDISKEGTSKIITTVDEQPASFKPQPHTELLPEPQENVTFFYYQKDAVNELLEGIMVKKFRAMMLLSFAGSGKTIMIGALVRRLINKGFLEGKTISPWPIIYVTKAPIVTKTERILKDWFGLKLDEEITVVNIEQMRAKFGEMFVSFKTSIVNGEEVTKFVWKKGLHPILMLIDESQQLKNLGSTQSKIFQSYNEIDDDNTIQIHFSATPLTRVIESKCFAVATHLKSKHASLSFREPIEVTNENFKVFADSIAYPADPKEYSPIAVEKLMKELAPYVVDVKGVRTQFRARNKVEYVEFESQEDRIFYESALERWEATKKKLLLEQETTGANTRMAILAAFTKFRQAAELCKAPILARRFAHRMSEGFAPVIGVSFKDTVTRIVSLLVTKHNIPRSKISLIWGGKTEGKSKSAKKKALRDKLANHKDFLTGLQELGLNMDDLGLTPTDIAELMDEESERLQKETSNSDLQLGSQDKRQRQIEIDNFQSGRTLGCIFTGKSGGVGLDLHHSDDLSPIKVRRKPDSNYAYEEDIPLIPVRQRVVDSTPVYSAIELVQIFGRCARLTSLSDTDQFMLCLLGTIEVGVGGSVSMKLRCLKKVVRQKEHWEDLIIKGQSDYDYKRIPKDTEFDNDGDEDDGSLLGGNGGDDDEDE